MEIIFMIILATVIFIFLTGKRMRKNMIQEEIYKLIYSRQSATVLRNIYFEVALKFALESGAALEPGRSMMDTDSIHFEINIDGTNYFI